MMHETYWMLRRMMRYPQAALIKWRVDIASWRRFWQDYDRYRRLAPADKKPDVKHLYPCLGDDTSQTPVEPIYFYQDTWAFEKITRRRPAAHVDVGSHHNFVAFLSKVLPVTMVDIRPLSLPLDTLGFRQGSILALPYEDESVESLSSLCVVEHIGLGRYGDPLDPDGSEKAVRELMRVLRPGGDLYISLPIEDECRTYFNAQRTFAEWYLEDLFRPFTVMEKRYIQAARLVEQRQDGFCIGLYHLQKPDDIKAVQKTIQAGLRGTKDAR